MGLEFSLNNSVILITGIVKLVDTFLWIKKRKKRGSPMGFFHKELCLHFPRLGILRPLKRGFFFLFFKLLLILSRFKT